MATIISAQSYYQSSYKRSKYQNKYILQKSMSKIDIACDFVLPSSYHSPSYPYYMPIEVFCKAFSSDKLDKVSKIHDFLNFSRFSFTKNTHQVLPTRIHHITNTHTVWTLSSLLDKTIKPFQRFAWLYFFSFGSTSPTR